MFTEILKLNDTLLTAFGWDNPPGTNDLQIVYLKFDSSLNILDLKTIGSATYGEIIRRAKINFDNEIICVGRAHDFVNIDDQNFFYKLSLNGDSIYSAYFGDTAYLSYENLFDFIQLNDTSGYYLFGHGYFSSFPYSSSYVYKTDNNAIVDTMIYLNGGYINTIQKINNNSFIRVTATDSLFPSTSPNTNLLVEYYDYGLNKINSILLGLKDTSDTEGINTIAMHNKKIYIGGTSNYSGPWEPDPVFFYLAQIDSIGNVNWEKAYSHNDDNLNMYFVRIANDGGILLGGTRYNDQTSNGQERDIYVIKLDSLGNSVTGINEQPAVQVHDVVVYPNPAQDVIKIQSSVQFYAVEFALYDATGRKALEKKINKNASVSVSHLQQGLYFYRVKDKEGKTVGGKIVIGD